MQGLGFYTQDHTVNESTYPIRVVTGLGKEVVDGGSHVYGGRYMEGPLLTNIRVDEVSEESLMKKIMMKKEI